MEVGKEIKRREWWRREREREREREKSEELEQGADGKRREREKELRRERERCWETFREEDTQRRIEIHGAENQFDIGVDPYSRNVKYLSGRILSGGKTIRVMVVLLSYFYFATTPTSLYSLAIRRNYTGTCHEESHLGSRRLCGLP